MSAGLQGSPETGLDGGRGDRGVGCVLAWEGGGLGCEEEEG